MMLACSSRQPGCDGPVSIISFVQKHKEELGRNELVLFGAKPLTPDSSESVHVFISSQNQP